MQQPERRVEAAGVLQHQTGNDIPAPVRERMGSMLNRQLADALHLQLHSKYAHWNVRGANFIALHGLFDSLASAVSAWADMLAERVVQLGGRGEGTLAQVAARSRLASERTDSDASEAQLASVRDNLVAFATAVRAGIGTAAGAGDDVSADILTEVARGADAQLWKVEAHLG